MKQPAEIVVYINIKRTIQTIPNLLNINLIDLIHTSSILQSQQFSVYKYQMLTSARWYILVY